MEERLVRVIVKLNDLNRPSAELHWYQSLMCRLIGELRHSNRPSKPKDQHVNISVVGNVGRTSRVLDVVILNLEKVCVWSVIARHSTVPFP
jgi:hypothetical protein